MAKMQTKRLIVQLEVKLDCQPTKLASVALTASSSLQVSQSEAARSLEKISLGKCDCGSEDKQKHAQSLPYSPDHLNNIFQELHLNIFNVLTNSTHIPWLI